MKGPGVVTGRSGSLGLFQFIQTDFWPHNTSLFIKDYKGHSRYFIHQLLLTLDFSKLNSGGAIPSLNRNTLSSISIIIPNSEIESKFDEQISPYYHLKKSLENKLYSTLELKSILLPRLISGTIKINT